MASVSRGRRLMGEINVVPYIDVMLVLLIIFMITAPLLTQGIKVDLPKAGAEPLDPEMLKNAIPLVLSVDRAGALYMNIGGGNPQDPLTAADVTARSQAALRQNPDLPVLVKADNHVEYGMVVRAMVILQKAGAKKVGFITDPLPDPSRDPAHRSHRQGSMLERTSDGWVSMALSVLLHGTLVAALVYGFLTYHRSPPPTPTLAIEGMVVDSRTVNGAALKTPPAPQPPAPATPPPPEPQPPEPVESAGPPEPTAEELAQREQALKEKEQQEQAQKDQAAKEQALKERAQQDQVERAAQEKQRQVDEQKKQQEAQRQAEAKRIADKAEAERKAAEAKRLAEQKKAEEAQRAADEKARQESEADLRNSLAAEEHANQVRNSGALASWVGQIAARMQRAWLRPPSARQGIQCVLHITQAPGGQVLSAKVESCNGDQAVRESIEAAAYRASPLPPPPDPSLFERDLEVTFRPD